MRIIPYLFVVVLFLPYESFPQAGNTFFVSNSGNDTNSGASIIHAKRTLAGVNAAINNIGSASKKVIIGIESGSIFNESFSPSAPVKIGTYSANSSKNDLATLNGSDAADSGWAVVVGQTFTFQKKVNSKAFTDGAVGGSNYICVIEIDKQLEKIAPFTARKVLQFVTSPGEAEATAGAFYEPVSNDTSVNIIVHPSNHISPNSNPNYRYEVTVRNRGIDSYRNDNNSFENLWVRGYGASYGLIPGGANSSYNKIVFGPGAAVHHVVLKSGIINNSLFLPGVKNVSLFSTVFYDIEGLGRHNKITNSIFMDIATPIYVHTSHSTNYGALELDNVIAFDDTLHSGNFLSTANTDSVILNNVYANGFRYGYNVGDGNLSANYSTITNCHFKDIDNAISYGSNAKRSYINNIFIQSAGKESFAGISLQNNTVLDFKNSIIHVKGNFPGTFISGTGRTSNHLSATGNIFIADVAQGQVVYAGVTNDNVASASSDKWNNNVYILLKGNIIWSVSNGDGNNVYKMLRSFDEWKKESGQDQSSLFFDLRNDPRGLRAIFLDPENGNYQLANTAEGNQVKALQAGMSDPVSCFLKKPSYEDAADIIRNDKVFNLNSCRYRCQEADINLSSVTNVNADGLIGICPNQQQVFKASGYYAQNDQSYHQSDITARYLWRFSDGKDTSGINLHSIPYTFKDTGAAMIQVQMVDQNGCSVQRTFRGSFQPLPVINLGNDVTICAGLDITLSADYKGANYLWNTGNTSNSITVKNKGTYWLQATLNGCSFKDSIELKLQNCPCTVQMPNAFSPNRDGINDVYKPVFGCAPSTFELSVYNRSGEIIFKTNDYKNSWNGLFNGKQLPVGAYPYVAKIVTEGQPKIQQLSGSILLLR